MSSSAPTRRARIAALALTAVMVLTLAGGAFLGATGSGAAQPPPSAPTTEAVVDLTDLTEEELAALLAEYGAAPTAPAPAPAP